MNMPKEEEEEKKKEERKKDLTYLVYNHSNSI